MSIKKLMDSLAKLNKPSEVMIRLACFVIVALIFILSLLLMKEGAGSLTPFIRGKFSVDSPASALGFGWLGANVAMSGSPVAATALALLDGGTLTDLETFTMIAGSRLGAAFVVLIIGVIYMLRGKQRDLSLSVGLLSLLVTQTIYPLVLLIGYVMISNDWFHSVKLTTANDIQSPIESFFNPIIQSLQQQIPAWVFLPLGFLMILISLYLFDWIIPKFQLNTVQMGLVHHLLYRPIVTFFLGAILTSITMSVSVSLSLLVPLSVRGYIRRENVIPYILGANITTFVDTLIAAALLANPLAVTVVIIQMISVSFVSLVLLLTVFRYYERFLDTLVMILGRRRSYLFAYVLIIFLVPFALIIFG